MNKISQQADVACHSHLHFVKRMVILSFVIASWSNIASADSLPELDCVIEPSEIVDVGSASAGVIEALAFDRGDNISKNDVVARLESGTEEAAAELARMRSQFDTGIKLRQTSAEFFDRNRQRSQSLQRSGISKQQLDQLDTEASVAQLQVRQEQDNRVIAKLEYRRAKQALKRRSIRSPIEGVVVERFKSVGEYVEDTAIMRIAKLDPLHIETIVPVSHMGKIKTGMQAQITPEVPGQDAEYAYVTRVDRVADAASGTFGVRLQLDNPDGDIVTGVRCTLNFDANLPVVQVNQERSSNGSLTVAPVVNEKFTGKLPADEQKVTLTATATAQCFRAGPVSQRASASELVEALTAVGHRAKVQEVASQYPGQSLVLTRQFENRTAANDMLERLEAKQVRDMNLIVSGSRAQRISLGLYNNPKSAQRRADELAELGFEVFIEPRSATSWWIDVATAKAIDVNGLRRQLAPTSPERVRAVPCATLQASNN